MEAVATVESSSSDEAQPESEDEPLFENGDIDDSSDALSLSDEGDASSEDLETGAGADTGLAGAFIKYLGVFVELWRPFSRAGIGCCAISTPSGLPSRLCHRAFSKRSLHASIFRCCILLECRTANRAATWGLGTSHEFNPSRGTSSLLPHPCPIEPVYHVQTASATC